MESLTLISWIAIIIGIVSSFIILIDIMKHPQMMRIMNVVWPINGWFLGPIGIWTYFKWGKLKAKDSDNEDKRGFPSKVYMSTSHCSAGCTLGDVVGIPIVIFTGLTILSSTLITHYIIQFVLAYLFGILFQFFAVYPMNKEVGKFAAFKKSIKADTLSLVTFEIGMFSWMAIVHYVLFSTPPEPSNITYWFMMQIAMIIGFLTSYPANWWLVKKGIKEVM